MMGLGGGGAHTPQKGIFMMGLGDFVAQTHHMLIFMLIF
jgi:hypothetical protein